MKGPFTRYERELHREKPIWRLLPLLFLFVSFVNLIAFGAMIAMLTALIGGIVFVMRQLNLFYLFSKEAEKLSAYHPLFTEACQKLAPLDTEPYHQMAFESSWVVLSQKGNGSGFLWQPNILITCKHCVTDTAIDLLCVINPATGRTCRVRQMSLHPEYDIAILELLDSSQNCTHVSLASANAAVDDPIWVHRQLSANNFSLLARDGFVTPAALTRWQPVYGAAGDVHTFNPGQQKTLMDVISGMSGSPVFNLAGDVVGMVIARAHHCSYMLPVDVIHATLKSCPFTKRFTTTA